MLSSSFTLCAQNEVSSGVLPKVVLSKKVNSTLKFAGTVESRHQYFNNLSSEKLNYNYTLTDIIGSASIKTGASTKANLAYTLRLIKGGEAVQRFTQQFTIVNNLNTIRLAHRITTDQTFTKNSATAYRLRYRIIVEKPLNGTKIDNKEFYFKLGNEYLFLLQSTNKNAELRLLPFIGYEINKSNRFEFGPDYRISKLLSQFEQDFWISATWYISL